MRLGPCMLGAMVLATGAMWPTLAPVVATVQPHRGDAVELVNATGFIEPSQLDRVTRGQALVRFDDGDLRGALAQARAQSVGATLAEQRAIKLFSRA